MIQQSENLDKYEKISLPKVTLNLILHMKEVGEFAVRYEQNIQFSFEEKVLCLKKELDSIIEDNSVDIEGLSKIKDRYDNWFKKEVLK
jgi:hypothetical protein|tara:strand:+ start:724 stop:987 length:264 start_codon:yes stop_codon:yes gene_type:complete